MKTSLGFIQLLCESFAVYSFLSTALNHSAALTPLNTSLLLAVWFCSATHPGAATRPSRLLSLILHFPHNGDELSCKSDKITGLLYIRFTYYPIIYHVEYNSIQLEINDSDLIRTAIAYFMWSLNQVIQSPVKTQP